MGIVTIGLTGKSGGKLAAACDICLHVPSDSTPLIQQAHIVAAHLICGLVENAMFADGATTQRSAFA
jgi:D-sedoheptulose 7-phosphate isomerase